MIDVSNLIKTPVISHGKPLEGRYIFLDTMGNVVCRTCTRCGLILDKTKFKKVAKNSNKVRSICKKCQNLAIREKNRYKGGLERRKRNIDFWRNHNIPVKCYICSGPFEEIEHVWSRKLGGPDTAINRLPVCEQCNRGVNGKRDRPLCEWLRDERPEYLELVISKVLSFGADPFTPCEKVTISPECVSTGRWKIRETCGERRYIDLTNRLMKEAYRTQLEHYA